MVSTRHARLFTLIERLHELHEKKSGVKLGTSDFYHHTVKWSGREDELEDMIKFMEREMRYVN